jgi:hypothetical protein
VRKKPRHELPEPIQPQPICPTKEKRAHCIGTCCKVLHKVLYPRRTEMDSKKKRHLYEHSRHEATMYSTNDARMHQSFEFELRQTQLTQNPAAIKAELWNPVSLRMARTFRTTKKKPNSGLDSGLDFSRFRLLCTTLLSSVITGLFSLSRITIYGRFWLPANFKLRSTGLSSEISFLDSPRDGHRSTHRLHHASCPSGSKLFTEARARIWSAIRKYNDPDDANDSWLLRWYPSLRRVSE